nr:uncharacterized protein LOC111416135 [Onthophagus taurus]
MGLFRFASGVRADGVQRLQQIIDRMDSNVHAAAVNAKKAAELWKQQSDKHPWVKTLKKHRAMVVHDLIGLCIDVYNDSLLETPTARTWPARSLAAMRAKSIQSQLNDSNDWEIQLDEFQPRGSALQYRDDVVYTEMLHVIGDTEKKKLRDEFKSALCISLQIDGSVDRGNQDMKYVVAKYVTKDQPTVLRSCFI